jgi:tRNA 2-thiouridine synthesizing protein A
MTTKILDATGLTCPLPVLRAKRALQELAAGEILEVRATDPGAVKDFGAFCETTGNRLLESAEADGVYRFRIEKGVVGKSAP